MTITTVTTPADFAARRRPMTREEKKVILASSAGTIFEWYDFYLYGSLAAIIGAQGESGRASVAQATAWPRRDQSSQTAAGRDRALPSDHLPGVW